MKVNLSLKCFRQMLETIKRICAIILYIFWNMQLFHTVARFYLSERSIFYDSQFIFCFFKIRGISRKKFVIFLQLCDTNAALKYNINLKRYIYFSNITVLSTRLSNTPIYLSFILIHHRSLLTVIYQESAWWKKSNNLTAPKMIHFKWNKTISLPFFS